MIETCKFKKSQSQKTGIFAQALLIRLAARFKSFLHCLINRRKTLQVFLPFKNKPDVLYQIL